MGGQTESYLLIGKYKAGGGGYKRRWSTAAKQKSSAMHAVHATLAVCCLLQTVDGQPSPDWKSQQARLPYSNTSHSQLQRERLCVEDGQTQQSPRLGPSAKCVLLTTCRWGEPGVLTNGCTTLTGQLAR